MTGHLHVDVFDEIAPVAQVWDDLAERVGADPFSRPFWFDAWFSAFGEGSLYVITARGDGRTVAVLPVQERAGSVSSPTNWHTPRFATVAEDPAAATYLAERVLNLGKRHVRMGFLDAGPAGVGGWERAATTHRGHAITRTLVRSPYIAVDGDWDSYQAGRSKRRRSELRRRRRRLEERGPVTIDVVDGRSGLSSLLREGFAIEAAGWKGEAGTAILSHPASERFYTEVARSAAARGWLRLAFLRVGGQAIAFDLGFDHQGVHYLLKQGNDPQWRQYGPGMLLREAMIRRSFAEGHRAYEFLGSDEPWKLEWTSTCHERLLFEYFDDSVAGSLGWLAQAYGRPLAGRLRASADRLVAQGRRLPPAARTRLPTGTGS